MKRMYTCSDIITEFIYNNPKEGYEIDAGFIKGVHDFTVAMDPATVGTEYFKLAEDIIAGHNEHWDGTGYPKGLKGEEIPLAARIIALADVFDVLTSTEIYKDALCFNKAVETIREERGKYFDPYIVDAFFSSLSQIHQSYLLNSDDCNIHSLFGSGIQH